MSLYKEFAMESGWLNHDSLDWDTITLNAIAERLTPADGQAINQMYKAESDKEKIQPILGQPKPRKRVVRYRHCRLCGQNYLYEGPGKHSCTPGSSAA